ncbi:MAG: hypothetical protein NPIRA06_29680 [Nitrospirales bacterium]|nr:MAG: hypothetical protein NPIRA06_29680 [Nitrospirales bacterium]
MVHVPWIPEKELDTLTVEGQRQAVAIKKILNDKGIVGILGSPSGRTCETLKAIDQIIGLKEGFEVDPAFASLREGKSQNGIQISWAWQEKQWALGQNPRPEGGESLSDGEFGAKGSLKNLAKKNPEKSVVIVSPDDICAALLSLSCSPNPSSQA